MSNIIVAGSGTNVGKTIVAAILTTIFKGAYWKPIECGESDTTSIKKLIDPTLKVYPPAYSLKAPLSPHHAARLENVEIDINTINLPQSHCPLIIESVGGILVPLTKHILSFELFKKWDCQWVIVSRHYLGSINHTFLTIQLLETQHIPIKGIIFNGSPNPDTETPILEISNIPFLGRLLPENNITPQIIQGYAQQWHSSAL